MEEIKEDILTQIVGTWKLISWKYKDENGNEVDFFGKDPIGILMYDNEGYMNVQIHKSDRPNFDTDGLLEGTTEEVGNAFTSYVAYYGKYSQEEPGILTHDVEGSLFPNWQDNFQKRYAEIEGDLLTLSTPPLSTGGQRINFTLQWRRFEA